MGNADQTPVGNRRQCALWFPGIVMVNHMLLHKRTYSHHNHAISPHHHYSHTFPTTTITITTGPQCVSCTRFQQRFEKRQWKINCPGRHGLKPFNSFRAGSVCAICSAAQPQNCLMTGCPACNYDVCSRCLISGCLAAYLFSFAERYLLILRLETSLRTYMRLLPSFLRENFAAQPLHLISLCASQLAWT